MSDDENPNRIAQYAMLAAVIFAAVFLAVVAGAALVLIAGF